MFALLVLNIERFLALTFPYFHQTSVTKRRLIFLLVALIILWTFVLSLSHLNMNMAMSLNILTVSGIPIILLLLSFLNYKMFIIARSRRDNEIVLSNRLRNRPTFLFKTFSTCSLTVMCYFVCSCPYVIYSVLRLTWTKNTPFQELVFYHLWTSSFFYINSTFNCLIFFWRNSILRREGMNTLKRFWSARFCRDCFSNEVLLENS